MKVNIRLKERSNIMIQMRHTILLLVVLAFLSGCQDETNGTSARPSSTPPSQPLQILPSALVRFLDVMNENPSQVKAAVIRLQQDLDGKRVALLFELQAASEPGQVESSFPKNLAEIDRGEFNIIAEKVKFDILDSDELPVGAEIPIEHGMKVGDDTIAVVCVDIVDVAWKQAP